MDTRRFVTLTSYIDALSRRVTSIQRAGEKFPSDMPMIESVLTEVHLHIDDAIELCDLYLGAAEPQERPHEDFCDADVEGELLVCDPSAI